MRIIINKIFHSFVLFSALSAPVQSTHAHRVDFEVTASGTTWARKEFLATSRFPEIQRQLRHGARLEALSKVQGICTDLRGRLADFGCEREVAASVVHRWGGRVGYEAYQTKVMVSAICVTDDYRLNWAEEGWYSLLFPVLGHCPSPSVIPTSNQNE